jgi:hypothetical protein
LSRSARADLTLAAGVLTMALNDHVLKRAYPGLVTGKLSDVAGMVFFPLLLALLVRPLLSRARVTARGADLALAALCVATALVFTWTKTTDVGNEAYRVAWGAMQWPARALAAWARGGAAPGLARVVLVKDPTDVLAAPFALVAYWAGRAPRAAQKPTSNMPRRPALKPYPMPEPDSV